MRSPSVPSYFITAAMEKRSVRIVSLALKLPALSSKEVIRARTTPCSSGPYSKRAPRYSP